MSTTNTIDDNGLLYVYQMILAQMPTKISDLTNDSDFVEDGNYVHTDNNFDNTSVSKLAALGTAANKNVPTSGNAGSSEVVLGNDTRLSDARTPTAHTHTKSQITDFPTLGSAAYKNSTNAVTSGSTDLVESGAVSDAINNAITRVYKPSGSKTCAELTSSLLIAANLGNCYNMSDSGTTTADFIEGAGKPIYAGNDVAIVDAGSGVYRFNLTGGVVDLSGYMKTTDLHFMTNAEIEELLNPTT